MWLPTLSRYSVSQNVGKPSVNVATDRYISFSFFLQNKIKNPLASNNVHGLVGWTTVEYDVRLVFIFFAFKFSWFLRVCDKETAHYVHTNYCFPSSYNESEKKGKGFNQ